MFILYIIGGLASGILGGMGMGGGTILIPVLTLFFNEPQHLAQALNLLSFIPMAIISLVIHFKNGFVKYKKVLYAIIPGLITCVSGCLLAREINGDLLKKIFGGFLTLLSMFQVLFSLKNKKFLCKMTMSKNQQMNKKCIKNKNK